MLPSTILAALAALTPLASAKKRDVFAHYLAGNIDYAVAETDVNAAKNMGFAAFAININAEALQSYWQDDGTRYLFDAAQEAGFKCFISMDLFNADEGMRNSFQTYVNKWMKHPAYYKHGGKPMLSTFNVGSTDPAKWSNFLGKLNNKGGVYFLPNPDNVGGYYEYNKPAGAQEFWDSWAPHVDGIFSWETAWTKDGKHNVSVSDWDEPHAAEAHRRSKSYMVPMSSLQFKHWIDGKNNDNWYRVGEVALPQRMTEVLAMDPQPDFAEVITWNDSGESHYIGTVHTRGQLEAFKEYANEETYSHVAWQELYHSFIDAFTSEERRDARGMRPMNGQKYVGAMWYRPITKDAKCRDRPRDADDAKDAVNWAVIVDSSVKNAYVQVYSNGKKILPREGQPPVKLHAGLNYGSVPGLVPGKQYIEVVEIDNLNGGAWKYAYTKTGDVSVTNDAKGGICNYNYLVYGLKAGRYN